MTDDNSGMTRYTVTEAARILDVGTDAVRKRIQRNTIKHERIDGTVYVWLDTDEPGHDGTDDGHDQQRDDGVARELVEAYREQVEDYRNQVEFLRRELERKDTIIMSMTQRVPELEAPPDTPSGESREPSESSSEERSGRETPPDQEQPSWWRRFFGL